MARKLVKVLVVVVVGALTTAVVVVAERAKATQDVEFLAIRGAKHPRDIDVSPLLIPLFLMGGVVREAEVEVFGMLTVRLIIFVL